MTITKMYQIIMMFLLTIERVRNSSGGSFFLCFIGAICHAEFISASRFRNKFAVTGKQEEILKQVQDDRSHTDWFDKLTNRVKLDNVTQTSWVALPNVSRTPYPKGLDNIIQDLWME